ncbi:DUF2637 domain-containing protein, partial [Nocardiopsis sp. MG754419]|nr:DUF2637 domain-containing protein [Nocardiopsis sp. MG754419]
MTMAPYNNAPETGTRDGRSADRGAGAGALVFGALFVGVIAVCTLFIAYEGIYRLAAIVHADSALPLAHVFPVTFSLLVLMAFWVSYTLRAAPPRERLWIDIGLIPLLILSAAVPMVVTRTAWFADLGDTLPRGLTVVVAVAPLAALLVAFLLWIAVRAHVRRRNAQARPRPKPSDDRTTVLRGVPGPRTESQEEAPEALKTRLLRLGGESGPAEAEDVRPPGKNVQKVEAGTPHDGDEATEEPDRAEEVEKVEEETPSAGGSAPEEREHRERSDRETPHTAEHHSAGASEPTDDPEAPTEPVPLPRDHHDEPAATASTGLTEDDPTAASDASDPGHSAPALGLPRRTRGGDNPIKRAAAEPPVVPGAATPAPEPAATTDSGADAPAPESRITTVEHRSEPSEASEPSIDAADEGFAHEPEVGDPSSDEAEAPRLAPVAAVPEPEADPAAEAETTADADAPSTPSPATPRTGEAPERLPGVRLFFPEHTPATPEPSDTAVASAEAPDATAVSDGSGVAGVCSGKNRRT